jgi:hypothetical protein
MDSGWMEEEEGEVRFLGKRRQREILEAPLSLSPSLLVHVP